MAFPFPYQRGNVGSANWLPNYVLNMSTLALESSLCQPIVFLALVHLQNSKQHLLKTPF